MIQTKKMMPGLIYIFWHIFIANHINNTFLKYQEFVNLLWGSKLYFSPISYICPYKFLSLYLPFLWKIEWKIKICVVKLINFINVNRTLVVIFMNLERSLYHLSLIEFNFDWLIYWILLLIDLLIDWIGIGIYWLIWIGIWWRLCTCTYPVHNSPNLGRHNWLIDCCGGRLCGSPQLSPRPRSPK
jgi:hypothetical protein